MAGRARWEAEAKWVVDASVNAELEQAGIVLESSEPATSARAAPAGQTPPSTALRPTSAPVSAPGSPSSPPQRGRPDISAWQTAVGAGDKANSTPASAPLLEDAYGTLGRLELLATAEELAQTEARLARLEAELNDIGQRQDQLVANPPSAQKPKRAGGSGRRPAGRRVREGDLEEVARQFRTAEVRTLPRCARLLIFSCPETKTHSHCKR